EATLGLAELRGADLLGPRTQRSDRRHDVERRLPCSEPLRLLGDDRLRALGLAPPAGERLGHDGLEIVDVVEVAALELADRRIEVARHRQIDEEERPAATPAERLRHLFATKDEAGSARRRDDHVGPLELA